ncbi:hypothetical protein QJS10_CPA08g01405 [Acorus calamus]|uniref:Uncharacterized protein n=1 Tax=Acorus calamus TaxID=4465 RepID=A0AAV9EB23_ACOCL|nr:hypothetical protein QJS10_CPA08g01405 [Acorus calamus]
MGRPAMRPIKLPEPPSVSVGMPEIFGGGAYSVVRRAVVIGNGFAGAENQCVGLSALWDSPTANPST